MGGSDSYSGSKGAAELAVHAYRHSFFNDESYALVASVRAGNVIGGGDWGQDRLVPDFARAARNKEAIRLRSPGAVRPWQHVIEPLRGYLMLAERLHAGDRAFAEGWNFGPQVEDARPVSWVAEKLQELWPEPVQVEVDDGKHPFETTYLKLDCTKTIASLGWKPGLALPEALNITANWYSTVGQDAGAARTITLDQIECYGMKAPRERAESVLHE